MKYTFLLIFAISCCQLSAQVDSVTLEGNNAAAYIATSGTYFYDVETQEKGYEIPKNGGVHALKSMQFWFAAKDENNEIYFSQGGKVDGKRDVFNGPISNLTTYNSSEYKNFWKSSLVSIRQATIEDFLMSYDCALDPNCDTEYSFTSDEMEAFNKWPAHGDLTKGQSFYLAPFVKNQHHLNENFYNPGTGDVPLIKGCNAAYLIQNDEAQTHALTNSQPIGIEIHTMFYQYHSSDLLNDITFVEVKSINKSGKDYSEFIHSIAIDAGVGNENDDYYGSDSITGMMYFYNADNVDEESENSLGYGENPPAIGVVALHQKSTSSVPLSGNESVQEKWNLMKGLQTNGNPWSHPNGAHSNFVFSENPNQTGGWSEFANSATPGNKRSLLSTEIKNFKEGDTLLQTYAIVYVREGNYLQNVDVLLDNAAFLQDKYNHDSDFLSCENSTVGIQEIDELQFILYPNPSSGSFSMNNPNQVGLSYTISNPQGKIIQKGNISNQQNPHFDVSEYGKGIYFLQIVTKERTITKKMVVK